MLKSITKTIRVPQDDMMKQFVSKQKNFSAAVRYLIFRYCRTHQEEIEDLSEHYDRELQQTIYQMHGSGAVTPPPPEQVAESIPRASMTIRQPIDFTKMCTTDAAIADTPKIPACYQ